MDSKKTDDKWLFEITPKRKLIDVNLSEIWRYRDLLALFIRRDIVAVYKQTVLGPLWFIIQPIFTSIIQFIVFSKIAEIPSDGIPYFLFVLTGNTLWTFFSSSFSASSNTFRVNAAIFGKVYFPRAIMPIATTASSLLKFLIQLILLVSVLIYFMSTGVELRPNYFLFTVPIIILIMGLISMGFGMVITSLTTKYSDFSKLMGFAISLFMYLTPVVYPTSLAVEKANEAGFASWLVYLNPLTGLFDLFKYAFLGEGLINWYAILWSCGFAVIIYLFGLVLFNRTEKSFMDTI